MQGLFGADGPWPTPWLELRLPVILEIARRYADRTVFTRFIPPPTPSAMWGRWRTYYERWPEVIGAGLDPDLIDLIPSLRSLVPPATVYDKPVYSPFHSRRFAALLRHRQTDTVVITGGETDVCVLSSVLGAIDFGLGVIVVRDAVCSSSDSGHDAVLTLFEQRLSLQLTVMTRSELVEMWHPGEPEPR
jgi:nicotinamidase-related amidase